MYKIEQLIWFNLHSPTSYLPQSMSGSLPRIGLPNTLQESRLSTRDGTRSCRVTAENCCKKMLSPPKPYVTVEAHLHSYHSRQRAKWWKKAFQETDTDLFQVFASNIITDQCPLLSSMPLDPNFKAVNSRLASLYNISTLK